MDTKESARIRQKKYRERHPERAKEACRAWRRNNPETFKISKQQWFEKNPGWRGDWTQKRRIMVKDMVFNSYGGYKCAECGETDPIVLTIDHINNDGAAHRKALGNHGGTAFFEKLRALGFPSGFQVLCRNCNWRKHITTLKVQRLERKLVGPSGPKREAPLLRG